MRGACTETLQTSNKSHGVSAGSKVVDIEQIHPPRSLTERIKARAEGATGEERSVDGVRAEGHDVRRGESSEIFCVPLDFYIKA